ncbi:hypothetical protein GPECTOR_148g21 [Gonium pectorale]|uniref:Uncharacterized protein n=1 Tax=Gonium pectorale TaxID=33097 RepID=A0A150FXS0_GONPE|nr:hypothetical protein GPECTOR_148g21 [Gonium pectorale]|eukprot:KXZ42424.1 hypothetical protein GPECTOR_148g21 [Gonium pectorale]
MGASHWACLQLDFQGNMASILLNRSTIMNNTVSSSSGAGALVFTSTQQVLDDGSNAALTVNISNSRLAGNTGGSGSALYSSVPLLVGARMFRACYVKGC